MREAFEFVTLMGAGLFAGAAVFVALVEHPVRLALPPSAALAQFADSYRRAAPLMALMALLTVGAGVGATALGSDWLWALGGGLVGSAIPVTLIAIMPLNRRLLAEPAPSEAEISEMLRRWGRLHALRAVGGVSGLLALVCEILL